MHPNGNVSQRCRFFTCKLHSILLIKNKTYINHIYTNQIGRLKTILTMTRVS